MSNINAICQSFHCTSCDTFFNSFQFGATSIYKQRTTYKNIPKNVHQIQKSFFDKLDSFGIKYICQLKIFKKLAKFDFEPIHIQECTFKGTNTTT